MAGRRLRAGFRGGTGGPEDEGREDFSLAATFAENTSVNGKIPGEADIGRRRSVL